MSRLFSKDSSANPRTAPTWRTIEQSTRRSPASVAARQHRMRHVIKVWSGCLLVCGLVVSLAYGYVLLREQVDKGVAAAPAATLREVAFSSDGVLTAAWANEFLGNPVGMSMGAISPAVFKAEIESNRQVRQARVSVEYPDRLIITVEERVPLLRARVAGTDGPEDLLVASDGIAFKGLNHPPEALRHLPYLEGVRLQKDPAGGYLPVAGLGTVEELVRAARTVAPDVLADWRTISLERFRGDPGAPGALLIARGRQVPEVVFAPDHFQEQLAQLVRIRSYAVQAGQRRLARVDLSFGDQAYVTWQGAATASSATPERAASSRRSR